VSGWPVLLALLAVSWGRGGAVMEAV